MLTDSFKNTLLREHSFDGTWYENERGRYLCVAGRSYGNTATSWIFNGTKLNYTNLTLPEGIECDLKLVGCHHICLKTLVSQLMPTDSLLPYHIMVTHSACPDDTEYFENANEYFDYTSLLMFGEISIANQGNYTFNISGNKGRYPDFKQLTTSINVTKLNIDSNIKLTAGSLTNPQTYLLKRPHQSYTILCTANHVAVNNTPQWFKDNQPVKQVVINDSGSVGCNHDNNLTLFYTVETNRSSTSNYGDEAYFKVGIYFSSVQLYLCNVTMATTEGIYSCNISNLNITDRKDIYVTVQQSSTVSSDEDTTTERLLIIWFTALNGLLIVAILVTLVVWCWMRCSTNKQRHVHSMCSDGGLPAYLHYTLELETAFTPDVSDSLEFPFDQLEFLHILGQSVVNI